MRSPDSITASSAVLDTNVVMSAIFFGGVPFDVLSTWHNGEFELVVSDAVMEEYREIAARMKAKFPSIEPERWMRSIEEHATVVPAVTLVAQVCEDADDDVFLACAVTANAKIVCSGDKHLLACNGWSGCGGFLPPEPPCDNTRYTAEVERLIKPHFTPCAEGQVLAY